MDERFIEKYQKVYLNHTKVNKVLSEYNIVLCTDIALFNPMMVLISSMAMKLTRKVNLYVLQSDFKAFRKDELKKFCKFIDINLYLVDVDKFSYSGFNKMRLPSQAFYYLDAHKYLPQEVDRALYLDIDTLITKDIADFYDIEFEDSWLAACIEHDDVKFMTYCRCLENIENEQFVYQPWYSTEILYNSGVLLLNLDKFRRNNININDFVKLQKNEDKITNFVDQILINRFTKYDVKLFPKLYYNLFSSWEENLRNLYENPADKHEYYKDSKIDESKVGTILHYTAFHEGQGQPWKALTNIDHNYNHVYRDYENKSQNQNIHMWWEQAQYIPQKNYRELEIYSIDFNKGKRLHNLSDVHNFFIKNYRAYPISFEGGQVIESVIISRSCKCNILVFGSKSLNQIWSSINKFGKTIYLESKNDISTNGQSCNEIDDLYYYNTSENSVEKTLNGEIFYVCRPSIIEQNEWDIIIIDGPEGDTPSAPGRYLPLKWTNEIMIKSTHVFVHDYERDLERHFTDILIKPNCFLSSSYHACTDNVMAWRNADKYLKITI